MFGPDADLEKVCDLTFVHDATTQTYILHPSLHGKTLKKQL